MRFGFREALFIMLLLGMLVASYFLIFKPQNERNADIRNEVHKKQAKLQLLQESTRNMDDLGRQIDKLSQAIANFERKLPSQREQDVILRQVSEMAAKHHLVTKNIRPDKQKPTAQYSEQPIPMSLIGDFQGVYQFLQDIERLPRITRMPKLQIKSIKSDAGNLEVNLTLTIFFDSSDAGKSAAAGAARAERDRT